tara:strand:+ start:405 stop:698 length:294 start_codon:yes stop_codon:yes gene_type:complete
MRNKYLLLLLFTLFLCNSCSDLTGKNLRKTDVFLIEKKNPLVMPPDIDDLPMPSEKSQIETEDNNFKKTLKSKKTKNKKIESVTSNSIEQSILNKID